MKAIESFGFYPCSSVCIRGLSFLNPRQSETPWPMFSDHRSVASCKESVFIRVDPWFSFFQDKNLSIQTVSSLKFAFSFASFFQRRLR